MNEEIIFCELARKLVPGCSDQFIVEIQIARAKAQHHVAEEKGGQASGKRDMLAAMGELEKCLLACIEIVDGKDRPLHSGVVHLDQALSGAYLLPDNEHTPAGCNEALAQLRIIHKAASAAREQIKKDIPDKWLKFGLRTAADGICDALERHKHKITAYKDGVACRLLGLLMDSLCSPRGEDSYRKAVQYYLLSHQSQKDRSDKIMKSFVNAITTALQGKSLPK